MELKSRDPGTQEQKEEKGRWECCSTFPVRWRCSVCKVDAKREYVNYNYCPNCEAEMSEE